MTPVNSATNPPPATTTEGVAAIPTTTQRVARQRLHISLTETGSVTTDLQTNRTTATITDPLMPVHFHIG